MKSFPSNARGAISEGKVAEGMDARNHDFDTASWEADPEECSKGIVSWAPCRREWNGSLKKRWSKSDIDRFDMNSMGTFVNTSHHPNPTLKASLATTWGWRMSIDLSFTWLEWNAPVMTVGAIMFLCSRWMMEIAVPCFCWIVSPWHSVLISNQGWRIIKHSWEIAGTTRSPYVTDIITVYNHKTLNDNRIWKIPQICTSYK